MCYLSQIRYFGLSVIPNRGNGDSGNHGVFLEYEYYKIISNTELASFDGDVIEVVYMHSSSSLLRLTRKSNAKEETQSIEGNGTGERSGVMETDDENS